MITIQAQKTSFRETENMAYVIRITKFCVISHRDLSHNNLTGPIPFPLPTNLTTL